MTQCVIMSRVQLTQRFNHLVNCIMRRLNALRHEGWVGVWWSTHVYFCGHVWWSTHVCGGVWWSVVEYTPMKIVNFWHDFC